MQRTISKKTTTTALIFTFLLFAAFSASAYTFTAKANGNWNASGTWTRSGSGSGNNFPGGTDAVVIPNNYSVTINITNAVCASLTFNSGGANGYTMMSFSAASSKLTVGGTITIGEVTADNITKSLNLGAGTLEAAALTMAATATPSGTTRVTRIQISTGVLTVSGDITMNGNNYLNRIDFSGAGRVNIGGNFMPATLASTDGGGFANTATSVINFYGTGVQQTFPRSVALAGGTTTPFNIEVNNTFVTGSDNDGNDGFELISAIAINNITVGNINAAAIFDENTFGSSITGSIVLNGTSRMIVRSANLAAFSSGDSFATGTTVEYVSNSAQTVNLGTGTIPFHHLKLSGSGTKNLNRSSSGALTINGDLTNASPVSYTNVSLIDLPANFNGTSAMTPGAIPVNIAGNWSNTASETITSDVTYDHATAAQVVSGNVTYTNLNFTGSGTKTVTRSAAGALAVNGNWTFSAAPAYSNINAINVGGNIEGTGFINSGAIPIGIAGHWNNTGAGTIAGLTTYTSASSQNVSANIRYDGGVTFAGAGSKAIIRNTSGPFDVRGIFTQNSPIASYSPNVSFIDMDGDYNGTHFINSGSLLIYMLRDWNNTANGTLTGLVRYDKQGGGTQVIGGGIRYHDINLEFGGTKVINSNGDAEVTGTLTITAGSTTFNTNDRLTLIQTATTMSGIAAVPAGSTVNGNVNVQIYINGGTAAHRGTRMMSSPVNDAAQADKTYKQLQNSILITGVQGGTGFDAGGTADPYAKTIRLYNEPAPPTPAAGNFTDISDINTSSPPGQGFFVFFRGDRSNPTGKLNEPFATPESVTATFTGPITTGAFVKNLSYTNNADSKDGYNAVGNPYPAIIDWHLVTKSANVGTTIQVIRRGNFGYATYNATTSTSVNGGSRYLQPAQGFYVQASATGQSLTFNESNKVSTAPAERLLSTPLNDQVMGGGLLRNDGLMDGPPPVSQTYTAPAFQRMILNLEGSQGKEEAAIVFMQGNSATAKLEDGSYTAGALVALSSLSSDGAQMAINMMPPVQQVQNILLRISSTVSGAMKMNFTELKDLENYKITLLDKYLNKQILVTSGSVYNFSIDRTIAATFGATRFELVFEAPSISLNSFAAEQVAQTSKLSWATASEVQSLRFELERSADGVTFSKIGEVNGAGTSTQINNYSFIDQNPAYGANHYRFKQYSANGRIFTSPVLQLTFDPPAAMVLSSFTAVKEGTGSKLNWTTSSEYLSARFDVEHSTDGSVFTKVGQVSGAGTSTLARNYTYIHPTPAYGTNYYRLKHYDAANQTLLSQVVEVVFAAPPAIALSSFNADKVGITAKLNWSTAAEFQSIKFNIERSADGVNFIKLAELSASGTSTQLINYTYTDQRPLPALNYYRLTHVNAANDVFTSAVIQLDFRPAEGVTLSSFTGMKDGKNAKLNWTTVNEMNAAGFEIERSTDGGSNFYQLGYISAAGTSASSQNYEFIDVQPEYVVNQYRLKYYTQSGEPKLSAVISLKFDPPPAIVLNTFTVTKAASDAKLDWTTSSEYQSVRFEVQHSTDGITFTVLADVNGSGTTETANNYTYTHSVIGFGNQYYRLKHYDANNQVIISQVVQVNFPPPPAMVLVSFSGKKVNGTSELSWLTSSEYQSARFDIERSADGINFMAIGTISGSGTTGKSRTYQFSDRQPQFGNNYYRLKHYDSNGQILLSNEVLLQYDTPGNVLQTEIKLYPNPVVETLYARFDNLSNSNLVVSVLDVQIGKRQSIENLAAGNTISKDVKDLKPGIYLLEIKEALSGKILVREKFIKSAQ